MFASFNRPDWRGGAVEQGTPMQATCYALLALALAPAFSNAKYDPPPMPAGYDDPGSKPDNVLDQIIARLRVELKDPYSIRDFILCPTTISGPNAPFSKHDHWQHARWSTSFALNSKNSFGGYTGQQNAYVWFNEGKIEELSFSTGEINSDFDARLARGRAAYLATCERIPDADIQKRLAA